MYKKAWRPLAIIGYPEVFDYLFIPITTCKAHACNGGRPLLYSGMNLLKVSKFQGNQC